MRLWPCELLPLLDDKRILGQHRECCALRGKGWGRKHATVDYVFTHSPLMLVSYHYKVMVEMQKRGYSFDIKWANPFYRGRELGVDGTFLGHNASIDTSESYPEHDPAYLRECLRNLARKGVDTTEIENKLKYKLQGGEHGNLGN